MACDKKGSPSKMPMKPSKMPMQMPDKAPNGNSPNVRTPGKNPKKK